MKEPRPGCRVYAMCLAIVVLSCYASFLLADSANASGDSEDEIRDLCKIVLSNPIDSAARRRLAGLRRQQLQRRRQALNALARGLKFYADDRFQSTIPDLSKAMQSKYVVDLANSVLLTPLEDVLEECKKHEKPKTRCPSCLDTKGAVCRDCSGSGVGICPECRGKGTAGRFSRPGSSGQCRACRGSGCFECSDCAGEGFVPCKRCAPKDGGMGANEREAIEKLIAMAVYLREGGLDFFTQDALRCSPRLRPEEPKDAQEQHEAMNSNTSATFISRM
ncbi:MAG: hypothetical protein ACYSWQ_09205 [Planctomycetota bacterium]|jgi:hypothetical protein